MMNRVVWCQNERLYCMVCETCGWSQTGSFAGYDCNQTREDPSGANVRACGFCDPACAGRQCGPDGCGGTCGTCGAGLGCDEQGHCAGYAPDAIDPDVAQPDAETDDVPLVVDTPLPDHPPPLDPGVDRTLVDTPVEEDVPADDIETPVPTHGGGCTSGAEAPALPCAMVLIGVAGLVAARRRRTLPDRP
jgi:MYXO-CTERM domain-containing protein